MRAVDGLARGAPDLRRGDAGDRASLVGEAAARSGDRSAARHPAGGRRRRRGATGPGPLPIIAISGASPPTPPAPGSGPKCRRATTLTAAVRSAVMGPPSSIAVGIPVSGSLTTTTAWMPSGRARCSSHSRRPASSPRGRRTRRRHGGATASRGRTRPPGAGGWRSSVGAGCAGAGERGHRQLGESQALLERHRRDHVGAGEPAQRRQRSGSGPRSAWPSGGL